MPTTILEFCQIPTGDVFDYSGRTHQKVDEQFAKVVPDSGDPTEEKCFLFYPETIVSVASDDAGGDSALESEGSLP